MTTKASGEEPLQGVQEPPLRAVADEVREPAGSYAYLPASSQDVQGSSLDSSAQLEASAWSDRDLAELLKLTSDRIDTNLQQVQAGLARMEARLGSLPS